MKIEIFPSGSGDCLLLTASDGTRLLADAGLPEAYDKFIAAPLSKLRAAGEAIEVAYVSHIDQDHIGGVLRLLDDEVKWRAYDHSAANGGRLRKPDAPRPPAINQIWHNAFLEDIERTEAIDLGAALSASATALSGLGAGGLGGPDGVKGAAWARNLALSVGEAIQVNWRIGSDQLDIPLNPDFDGKLMTARPGEPIDVGALKVTVIGPTNKELRVLRKAWITYLKGHAKMIDGLREKHRNDVEALGTNATPLDLARLAHDLTTAVEKDLTPPNLASLVLLVKDGERRILLTGDAGDESILGYLTEAGLMDAEGCIELDVLKVPHHGAHNAFSPAFAERIRATHYIFCGDGEHHNPEPDVVGGYLKAVKAKPLSGGRTTTFWFNWSSVRDTEFGELWSKLDTAFAALKPDDRIVRKSIGTNDTVLTIDLA